MKNKVLSLIFSTFLITSLNPVLGVSASEEATDSSAIEVGGDTLYLCIWRGI